MEEPLARQRITRARIAIVKMDGSTRGSQYSDVLKNYNLGGELGIGTFGKVKIAEHKHTGQKVAIKILNRSQMKNMGMEHKARREIKILRLFTHPHIIRLYEVIDTPTHIFLVMEYCRYGELFDCIAQKGRLLEDEARRIFQQIISGVDYCHRNMVVHRDLKPENLLLDSNYNIKIADFGLSNVMQDGHFLKTSCGSPHYAAPEVISGKLYVGPEVDVWSCGVILYALICGFLPFDDSNIPILFKKIIGGTYILPSLLSDLVRDLIRRMLAFDPMKRITIHEIREHPWFTNRLPLYLAVPSSAHLAKMIDQDTLQDVINLGYDKDHVCESLCNRLQNEATVAYYLLLDNRFQATIGYVGAEHQTLDWSYNEVASSESASSSTRQYLPGSNGSHGSGLHPYYPVERKWALGLQSRAHPREIMIEVLKSLHELNVRWKKNGHYNMKCMWCPGFPQVSDNGDANGRLPVVIKFEIQIYKTRDEKYLLDMQRVTGPQLLFLEFCAAFVTSIGAL